MSMGKKLAVVILIVVGLVIGCMILVYSQSSDRLLNDSVDGLFEASATILAFVSLGSILGVRLSANRDQGSVQFGAIGMVLICSAAVLLIQTAIIILFCCFDLYANVYALLMVATAVCFIIAFIGCLAYVFAQMDRASKQDE